MERNTVTEEDEGKKVVNADGDTVGMISGVKEGTAYVDPDPGMGEKLMGKLGWNDVDDDDYPLNRSKIDTITDDEVRLKRNL